MDNYILNKNKNVKINKIEKDIKLIEDKILKNSEKSIHEMKCMFCKKDFNKKYNTGIVIRKCDEIENLFLPHFNSYYLVYFNTKETLAILEQDGEASQRFRRPGVHRRAQPDRYCRPGDCRISPAG